MANYTEEQAFRRAIAAEPAEDTPRLAYADWLDGRGPGGRARLIRADLGVGPKPYWNPFQGEWLRVGHCPACLDGVDLFGTPTHRPRCKLCGGSHDCGGLLDPDPNPPPGCGAVPRRVEWERGFPFRVHCSLWDVCETPGVARRVVAWHRVTEFWVAQPFTSADVEFAWHKGALPRFLFDRIEGHDSTTDVAAHTAMARALGAWVREFPETLDYDQPEEAT